MKLFFLSIIVSISMGKTLLAQDLYPITDLRKDSVSLIAINLDMDMRAVAAGVFKAKATLELKAKINGLQGITIDLGSPIIDSVFFNGNKISYTRSLNGFYCLFTAVQNQNSTFEIDVFYTLRNNRDPSGFGGFYVVSDYAYAIGVGFTADPHPYGRSWFPCFDNFVMKSPYVFKIRTDTGFAAVCGGNLVSAVKQNDFIDWTYQLNQPIPSYLVSLAVSKYHLLAGDIQSKSGAIPYILAAKAQDTAKLKASFANFGGAVNAFEHYYGTYFWDRLGYHAVPFNGGAMEHACNISYPLFAVDSTLNREDLMAHELAHHWWGNNITCKTQEDMWINEGWASYSEKLFNEYVYGPAQYRQKVAETHRNVLQFAHINDGEILPVSGIGHQHTYGSHVYNKGADIAHTLRGFMGDSSFFKAIKYLMEVKKFGNMDSKELIDSFQQFSPVDLSSFYTHWVKGIGFPHFQVIGLKSTLLNGKYKTTVEVLQRTRWDVAQHDMVPLDITFMGKDLYPFTFPFLAGKYQSNFEIELDFEPLWAGIDIDAKISDATTDTFRTITNIGKYTFPDGLMEIEVSQLSAPAFLHVTHNWLAVNKELQTAALPVLSTQRYWTFGGVFPAIFKATAAVKYNSRTNARNGDFFLDQGFIIGNEDSLVLMYRKDAKTAWTITDATINTGVSKFDREGSFTINNLQAGDYCIAIYRNKLGIGLTDGEQENLKIYPNPSQGVLKIALPKSNSAYDIKIYDMAGKQVYNQSNVLLSSPYSISTVNWKAGNYLISVAQNGAIKDQGQFVLIK